MSKVSTSSLNQKTSDYESEVYDYAISALSALLPSINSVDSASQNQISSIIDSYTNSGVNDINDLYASDLYDLQTDSASRFGNLDNSIYLDNLSGLSEERADAVSSFESDVKSLQDDLETEVIDKNYDYADLLSGIINDYYSNSSTVADIYALMKSLSDSSSSSSSSSTLGNIKTIQSLVSNFASLL